MFIQVKDLDFLILFITEVHKMMNWGFGEEYIKPPYICFILSNLVLQQFLIYVTIYVTYK